MKCDKSISKAGYLIAVDSVNDSDKFSSIGVNENFTEQIRLKMFYISSD